MPWTKIFAFLATAFRWEFSGDDKNKARRTILFSLLISALTACGIMAFYIRHLWNLPKGQQFTPVAASAPASTDHGGHHAESVRIH
jgi:hypothetical protein